MRAEENHGSLVATAGTALFRVLLVNINAMVTMQLWMNAPTSLTARLVETGGPWAYAIMWAMLIAVVFGVLDTLLNDAAGVIFGRVLAPLLEYYRPQIIMTVGVLYMILGAACFVEGPEGSWVLVYSYLGNAVCAFSYPILGNMKWRRYFAKLAAEQAAEENGAGHVAHPY